MSKKSNGLMAKVNKRGKLIDKALKQATRVGSEMAAGAIASIHEGIDIGCGSGPMPGGELSGYLRVTVLQVNSEKKGRLKGVPPSVMLKMELVGKDAPREVLVGWGERLCHQGDTISIVGPEVRIPFRIEMVPK